MSESLAIMFDDLTEEAQKKVLGFYKLEETELESAKDGNLGISPVFILEREETSE